MSKRIKYNPRLISLARELRNNGTLSEVLLWNHLKNRRMGGFKFHRQKPIDEFIVDFYSYDLELIIEIDGSSHKFKGVEDFDRQEKLESLGLHVMRFEDLAVKQSIEWVVESIRSWVEEHGNTPPDLPGHPS